MLHISNEFDALEATKKAAKQALDNLDQKPNLCIFHAHVDDPKLLEIPELLKKEMGPDVTLMGSAADFGFIGGGSEYQVHIFLLHLHVDTTLPLFHTFGECLNVQPYCRVVYPAYLSL